MEGKMRKDEKSKENNENNKNCSEWGGFGGDYGIGSENKKRVRESHVFCARTTRNDKERENNGKQNTAKGRQRASPT